MAKVALIGMYDSWVIGLRNLANALVEKGHQVTIIHFKLMVSRREPFYLRNTLQYQTVDSETSRNEFLVNSYNTDVQPWTYSELQSMGDLLVDLQPDIIGLSTRSVYESYLFDIARQMRRVPGAWTIAGGHDASFRPEFYVDHMDFACVGEGEEALIQLADCIETGADPRGIPNLVWRNNGQIQKNPLAKPREDKDYFFSELQDRVVHYVCHNNRIIRADALLRDVPGQLNFYYTMIGRGCTGKCAYCTAGHFQGLYSHQNLSMKLRRMRDIDGVIRELITAKEKGFRQVTFLDSFLVAPKKYLLSFFRSYERSVSLPFFAQLHPDQVLGYPEVLGAALDAGLNRTVVGIQSGSERVNRDIFNRKTTHRKLLAFAETLVGRRSLKVDYHIVTHNPFDGQEDFEQTLKLIRELPKMNCSLFLFRLYAFVNTQLHQLTQAAGAAPLDIRLHDKRAVMCLIRWAAPDAVFNDIYSHFDNMSFEDLRQLYRQIKNNIKSDVDLVLEAQEHMNKQSFAVAMQLYDQALLLNPGSYDAWVGKGWASLATGTADQAESCFQAALKRYPLGTQDVWLQLGELKQRSGLFQESVKYLERARFLTSPVHRSDYGKILVDLANAHSQNGDMIKARDLLSEAIEYLGHEDRNRIVGLRNRLQVYLSDLHPIHRATAFASEAFR